MARTHRAYRIVAALVVCIIVLSLSTSTGRDRRGPDVDAHIYSVPVTETDAARAINAYERLMERHMDMTERNLAGLAADLQAFAGEFNSVNLRLDAIDAKLAQIDQRLERIERHLGVPLVSPARPDPNAPAPPKPPVSGLPDTQP